MWMSRCDLRSNASESKGWSGLYCRTLTQPEDFQQLGIERAIHGWKARNNILMQAIFVISCYEVIFITPQSKSIVIHFYQVFVMFVRPVMLRESCGWMFCRNLFLWTFTSVHANLACNVHLVQWRLTWRLERNAGLGKATSKREISSCQHEGKEASSRTESETNLLIVQVSLQQLWEMFVHSRNSSLQLVMNAN